MKSSMVAIGNFLFHHRNALFPIIVTGLFMIAVSPHQLFGSMILEDVKDGLAFLIALSGLAIRCAVVGYSYVKRAGLSKNIHANELVTFGMFSLCRNPLYLGNMLIYIGVFVMHGDLLVMALGITVYTFIYYCIIFAEEAYLTEKFGDDYRDYCRQVPRWIPRVMHLRAALGDMHFDRKRVIMTEYSTAASMMVTLLIVLLYEHLSFPSLDGHYWHMALLVAGLFFVGFAASAIRKWKKKQPRSNNGIHCGA